MCYMYVYVIIVHLGTAPHENRVYKTVCVLGMPYIVIIIILNYKYHIFCLTLYI